MDLHEYARATEINVIFILAVTMMSPVLAPYIKNLGFNDIQLGVLFSITPLVLVFSSTIIGSMSDNIGRRKAILYGIGGEIAAIIIYISSTNWILFVIARILDAVAATTVVIVSLATIEDNIKDKTRGKYTGISLSIEYVGRLLGPLAGGLLADIFFIKAPFITSIFVISFLLLILPRKKLGRIRKKSLKWSEGIRHFLSFKKLKGMAIIGIVMHSAIPAFLVFLPLLITEDMNLSYAFVGYALFALELPHILQFVFGKWADKQACKLILIGALLSGMLMSLISQINLYLILVLILFIRGIGLSMWNISGWTLMSKIGEKKKMEGEIIGSYLSIVKIGSFASFILSGLFAYIYGIESLFLVNGIIIVLGTVLAYPFLKN